MKSNKEGKDEELIQLSTTSDPGYQWESDNPLIRNSGLASVNCEANFLNISISMQVFGLLILMPAKNNFECNIVNFSVEETRPDFITLNNFLQKGCKICPHGKLGKPCLP